MTEPQTFRRLQSVEVQAMRWQPEDHDAMCSLVEWLIASGGFLDYDETSSALRVTTPAGDVPATPGDWVVRDEAGSWWVHGPVAFAARYAEVDPR